MTATIDPERTLAELVLEQPHLAPVFEQLGLDYCCGGQSRLTDAAAERGLAPAALTAALEAAERADGVSCTERDWREATMTELCDHIVEVHHAYLRRELPQIDGLLTKVVDRHGGRAPELERLQARFGELNGALIDHIDSEEQTVFPLCRSLESGGEARIVPRGLGVHEAEHAAVGQALRSMRELTGGYDPEQAFCTTHRVLLGSLQELEADLHQHIHEENNILFPRLQAQT